MNKPIVILGCTASGKSDLAESLALGLAVRLRLPAPAPVMAVDSMQVYRGMDIGTAKPDAATRARIPYLMLDVADPWEAYSAARFVDQAQAHLENTPRPTPAAIPSPPTVLVAGTFLYLRALIDGLFEGPGADEKIRAELHSRAQALGTPALHAQLAAIDPPAAQRIHPNDLRRIVRALEVHRLTGTPISTLQTQWNQAHPARGAIYLGIRRDKEALNRRINARVRAMIDRGLVEEVRRLANDPRGFSQEASSAVGYKQLLDHFAGKCSLDHALEQIKIHTRHLAKMQRTWLKRWPPPGKVHWIDAAEGDPAESIVQRALSHLEAQWITHTENQT